MSISRYVIVDDDGVEEPWEYHCFRDAQAEANLRSHPVAIVEREYVYDDSTLVWASDGSTVWPPQENQHV